MGLEAVRLTALRNRGRVQVQLRQPLVELTVDEARQLMADLHVMAKTVAGRQAEPTSRKETGFGADPLARAHVQKRVLGLLEAAAAACAPCPSNSDLCAALGLPRLAASEVIGALEARGLIRVERLSNFRVVTIVETGAQTAAPAVTRRAARRAMRAA
jgi:hypothetical protein